MCPLCVLAIMLVLTLTFGLATKRELRRALKCKACGICCSWTKLKCMLQMAKQTLISMKGRRHKEIKNAIAK
ncbi:MAG: hypothetical protein AOA65_1669 [Candidatus Bathyarchaeota archaeon BA1]|nr:MAG: hypothetical protein AOA65_1669 [Candidatus Bathyarchaeota archaeon BA1]